MYNKLLRGEFMSKNKKLANYSKFVELAHKELQIRYAGNNTRVGIYNDEFLKRKFFKDIVVKYSTLLNEDELNIFELNLYVTNNYDFYTSLNNLAVEIGYNDFREVLKEGDLNKIASVVSKLATYYGLEKSIVTRKIKEVLIYSVEIDEYQKKKIK